MALQGKKINNLEFMKQLADVESERVSNEKINKNQMEMIEYIDLDLLDDPPIEWNDYPKLADIDPGKYLELKMSIYDLGICQALIVWEKDDGHYMILAGCNRKNALKEIIEECSEKKDFDISKYKMVPCIVKKKNSINVEQAQEIIDDTNCTQREFSKLPRELQIKITQRRMLAYKKREYSNGQTIYQLSQELNLKKTTIYENLTIMNDIIGEIQQLYYNLILTRKAVLKFAFFDKEIQKWMYQNFREKINDNKAKQLRKGMNKEQIEEIFKRCNNSRTKRMTVEIPEEKLEEFEKLLKEFLDKR